MSDSNALPSEGPFEWSPPGSLDDSIRLTTERLELRLYRLDEAETLLRAAHRVGRWSVLLSDAEQDEARYLEYDGPQLLHAQRVEAELCTANHSLEGPAEGCEVPDLERKPIDEIRLRV